jgi:hypothetical protein
LAKNKENKNTLTKAIEAEESFTNENCHQDNDLSEKVPVKLNNDIKERSDAEALDETDQSLKLNETKESFCHIQSLYNNEIHEFLKTKGRSKNDVRRLCEKKKKIVRTNHAENRRSWSFYLFNFVICVLMAIFKVLLLDYVNQRFF